VQQRWYSENGEDVAERVPVHRTTQGGERQDPNDGMAMQPPHRNLPPTKVIYVGNLKYEVTVQDLEEKFQEFGEIRGIRIPRTNDTGIPRG
jgi:RNA recognition motif-containing protein